MLWWQRGPLGRHSLRGVKLIWIFFLYLSNSNIIFHTASFSCKENQDSSSNHPVFDENWKERCYGSVVWLQCQVVTSLALCGSERCFSAGARPSPLVESLVSNRFKSLVLPVTFHAYNSSMYSKNLVPEKWTVSSGQRDSKLILQFLTQKRSGCIGTGLCVPGLSSGLSLTPSRKKDAWTSWSFWSIIRNFCETWKWSNGSSEVGHSTTAAWRNNW